MGVHKDETKHVAVPNEEPSARKPPVSARKVEANRKNSLKSTGPTTTAGQSYSSRNSVKHGIFAKALFAYPIPMNENPRDFAKLLKGIQTDFKPVGALEEAEVEVIANCYWQYQRLYRWEAGLLVAQSAGGLREVPRAIEVAKATEFGPRISVLQSVKKEIETTQSVSSELRSRIFETMPEVKEAWIDIEKHATYLAQKDPELGNPKAEILERVVTVLLEREQKREREFEERAPKIAGDCSIVPQEHALDLLRRYSTLIQTRLDAALDRLEKFQRRRKAESLRLTATSTDAMPN